MIKIHICRICNNITGNKSFMAREMMFGYREKFEYFECVECGCLQIVKIPNNLSKYYTEKYYSLGKIGYFRKDNFLIAFLKHQRARYWLSQKSITGMLLSKLYKKPIYYNYFQKVNIEFESEILDIGCGIGHLLLNMKNDGFSNLTGIDPFIDNNIFYDNGLIILKKELSQIDKYFDFIMLHHSYEHLEKPLSVLKILNSILKSDRYILIKTPIASSFAWKKYGINWVQLDAPRHLFLHTIKSMRILANQSGFKIRDIVFESGAFQFWGSEQYLKDIPLISSNSYAENPEKSIFSKEQIQLFKKKAMELNRNNVGDTACFYLYKT